LNVLFFGEKKKKRKIRKCLPQKIMEELKKGKGKEHNRHPENLRFGAGREGSDPGEGREDQEEGA